MSLNNNEIEIMKKTKIKEICVRFRCQRYINKRDVKDNKMCMRVKVVFCTRHINDYSHTWYYMIQMFAQVYVVKKTDHTLPHLRTRWYAELFLVNNSSSIWQDKIMHVWMTQQSVNFDVNSFKGQPRFGTQEVLKQLKGYTSLRI